MINVEKIFSEIVLRATAPFVATERPSIFNSWAIKKLLFISFIKLIKRSSLVNDSARIKAGYR